MIAFALMFGVILIYVPIFLFVLLRVDKQANEEREATKVEDSEQELAEVQLCP
jgi:hypothetical protein